GVAATRPPREGEEADDRRPVGSPARSTLERADARGPRQAPQPASSDARRAAGADSAGELTERLRMAVRFAIASPRRFGPQRPQRHRARRPLAGIRLAAV